MTYDLRLKKAILFSLYLYAVFAPHSIFLSEAFIILGLVLSGIKIALSRKREGRWVWVSGSLEKPVLAFFAVGFFSLLTAYDRFQALGAVKSLWLFLFYFLVINNVSERKDVMRLVTVLVISTAFAALYGLYQYFFKHTLAVQAFIKNVITLAGLFLLAVPISFGLFLGKKRVIPRAVYLTTSIFILLGLVFTMERSVWIGFGVAVFTFLIMGRQSLTVAVIGIIIMGLLFLIFPVLRARARILAEFDNYAITSRLHQWQAGLEMMLDHPLTGVGPGNYDIIYKQYKFFEERKIYPHAHSNIVQIGAETGILGLSIFFWLMISGLKIIRTKIRVVRDPMVSLFSIGVLAAFLGFNFAGLFEYNFGDSEVQLLFWFILGSIERI